MTCSDQIFKGQCNAINIMRVLKFVPLYLILMSVNSQVAHVNP